MTNDSPQSPNAPSEGAPAEKPRSAITAPHDVGDPTATWEDMGLSQEMIDLVYKAGYKRPSPVQAKTLPVALDGYDVIGSAQTGTGKTASFVLPMVEKFAGREGTYGLILAPTREIAQQIQATIELFGAPRGVRSIVLIGGVDMRHDTAALATYPHIIVATPGRLCDHLDRGNIWLDFIEIVVLDEADRMLDMGFTTQLNRIMDDVPQQRQTMLFSATFPPYVEKFAMRILHEPERVTIGRDSSAAATVDQKLLFMREEAKMRELLRLLRNEPGSIMIFTRSKDAATRLWRSLHSAGIYDATYIHSDRLQSHREQALAEFKEGKFRILIATDVAARGLHVEGVAHVVNYELPFETENYVHRIGRTGRAGQTGKATTFVTPRDRGMLRDIEKMIGKEIPSLNGRGEDFGDERGGGRGGDRDRGRGRREQAPTGGANPVGASAGSGEGAAPGAPAGEGGARRRRRRGGRGHGGAGGERPASAAGAAMATPGGAAAPMSLSDAGGAPNGAVPAAEGGALGEGAKRRRRRRGGRGRRGKGGGAGGAESRGDSAGGSGPSDAPAGD